ncbi:731_t:CDS:2, partial [Paraglomus brasilianum]
AELQIVFRGKVDESVIESFTLQTGCCLNETDQTTTTGSNRPRYIPKEVIELLLAADEMQLEELTKPVQMHLLQEWEPWNSVKLYSAPSKTLLDDPAILFKTGDYLTADEDTLISVLERNDLVMDEAIPTIGKSGYDPPRRLLYQVKKILPRELYQAILKRQFIPSSPLSLNVLPPRTEPVFLLRGSVSGFTPKTFHELCDAKGPTMIIIKPPYSNDLIRRRIRLLLSTRKLCNADIFECGDVSVKEYKVFSVNDRWDDERGWQAGGLQPGNESGAELRDQSRDNPR